MDSVLFTKVRDWVLNIHDNADHLVRTVDWLDKLDPEAGEALRIAAVAHDVERAFGEGRIPPTSEYVDWDDPVYNLWHGERSAKFLSGFLRRHGAEKNLIREVGRLVVVHEVGGFPEADILKDADSLSFLEINVDKFISWIPEKVSKEEVKKKFDYMFNRIGSSKATKWAQPLYEGACAKLGEREKD